MKNNTTKLYGVVALAALLPSVAFSQYSGSGPHDIDGTVTIQSVGGGATYDINDDGQGVNPDIPDGVDPLTLINGLADTTPVYTQLGGATVEETDLDNTGIIAETNGDLTLLSDQGTESTFTYVRAVRNDVWNADQGANAGQSAQTVNIGGYVDPGTGDFVELGELDLAENWDPAFIGTPLEGELILDPGIALDPAVEEMLTMETEIPGSGGNLQVGGSANVDGVLSVGDVADVEMALGDNTSDIAMNASDIADNASTLVVHEGLVLQNIADIADNASDIADNASTLVVHEGLVLQNIADIATNATDIATNAADIASNAASITANAADIADNASTLVVHEGLVTQNIADIAANAADIADNASTLVVHEGLVTQNIADIAANSTAIGNNWAAIDNIQTNGIAGIIEKKSDGIHIGEDSLVTNLNAESGNQDLWALNDGELTDINFLSDVNVVSKLTVQAAAEDSKTVVTPATQIEPPYLDEAGVVDNTVAVYTKTGDVAVTTTNFDNSGVVATANGDLSLYASGGTQDVTSYITAVRADIWDETQGENAGFVAGESEVGGYMDDNGTPDDTSDDMFVELGVLVDGVLDLDSLTTEQLAMITTAGEELPGGGGNLLVEGNARIDGALKLGTIENVEQSILDEVAARAAADETLAAAIEAEAMDRAAADLELDGKITQNATAIADEAAARAAADADIVAGYMAADSAIVSGYMQADSLLAARISSVEEKVESNTRGIAMVAALTSPTVREGMENALDFSLAHFDGETGAAISYARRVNENVQLNIAAASTTDFDESVVRGGVSLQW